MLYGSLEYAHAEPFANELANDPLFRSWVLLQTKFSCFPDARLLNEEMRLRRSKKTMTWWRSHYAEKCRCLGCSGQETDLLAVFEAMDGKRFALHFEVKQPTDKFPRTKDQAGNYNVRAAYWVRSTPASVLPHSDASTVLLCSAAKLAEYGSNATSFGALITFEDLARKFPRATIASTAVSN